MIPPPPPPPMRMDMLVMMNGGSPANNSNTAMKTPTPEPPSPRVPFSQLPALRFRDFSCRSVSPTPSTTSKNSSEGVVTPGVKKTVKLFWKEVKEDKALLSRLSKKKTIWDEIKPVAIDVQKFEHLFENRSKEIMSKKSQEGKKSEILVLDAKRSNAINIGMTKLPPPRVLKTVIIEMNSWLIGKDGVEKMLSMMPSSGEINLISEAMRNNPLVPLGTAESFLMALSSIPALEERLKLWLFRLEFHSIERELAEQLMDLKTAMHDICNNATFKIILATLLSLGNFLNSVQCKGFQLDYLSKVSEVKDTLTKHSLVYHVASIVLEKDDKSSDLYSNFGSVCRASNIDFEHLTRSVQRLEEECRVSFVRLKIIRQSQDINEDKNRIGELNDFLYDCQKRISVLQVVHRRVQNRYRKTLVYLGFDPNVVRQLKHNEFFTIIKDFALDYKTNYDKIKERSDYKIHNSSNHNQFDSNNHNGNSNPRPWTNSLSNNLSNNKFSNGKTTQNGYSIGNQLKDVDEEIIDTLVKSSVSSSCTLQKNRQQRMRKQSSCPSSTVSSISSVLSSISCSSNSSNDSDIISEPIKHSTKSGEESCASSFESVLTDRFCNYLGI
jgi:hypothetical protein